MPVETTAVPLVKRQGVGPLPPDPGLDTSIRMPSKHPHIKENEPRQRKWSNRGQDVWIGRRGTRALD